MIEGLLETVKAALAENQFLSGGAVLMVLGAIAASLRKVPGMLLAFGVRQFTVSVEVRNRTVVNWFDFWLREQPEGRSCRRLKVEVGNSRSRKGPSGPGSAREDLPEPVMIPGNGTLWLRREGRVFIVERGHDDPKSSAHSGDQSFFDMLKQEVITIRTYGRDASPIYRMLAEARDLAVSRENRDEVTVSVNRGSDWYSFRAGRSRPLESVVLADGIADDLVSDVKKFLSAERREWYHNLGIPYRRGYLLDGPPGSGKSSLVKALACEIGLGLYVLDLTESRLTDTDVAWMLSTLPPRAAVLIEDIDCLELARSRDDEREKAEKKTGESKVTLSGLLNAIDGVAAAEGRLLFLTSNHPGRVDAAMLRPGRIDRRFFVGPATAGQAERLFRRFFPGSDGLATRFAGLVSKRPRETSMAELQELLIQHAEDSRSAVAAAKSKMEVTP